MKTGMWDYITDQMKNEIENIRTTIQIDFKGTKPYRQVRITPEEQVAKYLSYPEPVKQQLRQDFPQWNDYEAKVLKQMDRLKGVKNG